MATFSPGQRSPWWALTVLAVEMLAHLSGILVPSILGHAPLVGKERRSQAGFQPARPAPLGAVAPAQLPEDSPLGSLQQEWLPLCAWRRVPLGAKPVRVESRRGD